MTVTDGAQELRFAYQTDAVFVKKAWPPTPKRYRIAPMNRLQSAAGSLPSADGFEMVENKQDPPPRGQAL